MRDYRHAWITEWRACAAAFQFLTRFPVNIQLQYTDDLFRRSAVYYPLVGAAIGGLLALAGWLLGFVLPAAPAAVLVLGIWVAATGALHLDGLMDTADGLLSHRSRERMLEIMKDSRVGAMGVVAGVLLMLLKGSLLLSLPLQSAAYGAAVMAAPLWSRAFVVWAIAGWPYAREGKGLGSLFAAVTRAEAWKATALAVAAGLLLFAAYGLSWGEAAAYALGLTVITGAVGYGLARAMAGKLGGLTGDTYGALIELLECTALLAAVVAASR
ncbi:adenosylcobinamide-GDP ribazoletransferase [Paenibacillus hodogayensis]|uniref:Adenosylcobinamide-GDP ribazoletransferase n=1 Tax=Paenibacillus hodogayensis TaxID=279208 RepID=A0ABV5VRC2_9BACL